MIGTPPDALSIPNSITSDGHGRAQLDIAVKALDPSARGYVDGQIYLIQYRIDAESPNAHPQLELIVVHARDSYTAPVKPAWIPDIAPIFTQYGNLYPIMSQRLVDLSDPQSVKRNLRILQLAFSLDIADPNYMPVTRDLSAGKRAAIQRWLARLQTDDDPTFVGAPRERVASAATVQALTARVSAEPPEQLGGKTTFELSLERSLRALRQKSSGGGNA